MKIYNVVLIGVGAVAKLHAETIKNMQNANLYGVYGTTYSSVCSFVNEFGCKPIKTLNEVLNDKNVDIVSICTPSGTHCELAVQIANAKKHLIIEKPMAMNIEDAEKIIKSSSEKGVKVSACHQNRFNVAVQKTRQAVENGRLGKLSHGSIHVRWNRNKDYYTQAPWRGTWAPRGCGRVRSG